MILTEMRQTIWHAAHYRYHDRVYHFICHLPAQLFLHGRRGAFLHDLGDVYKRQSLYRAVARVLPVIAPDMSVPMFLSSVLSDHLERYQDIINEIYNQEACLLYTSRCV